MTLKLYSLTNRAHYMGLGCKFLQTNGLGAAIPAAPPTVRFQGDSVTVMAEAKNGSATFAADKANAAGVKTELLAQRLASPDRAPSADAYASQGFVAFVVGNLSAQVTLGPGAWALAYRFVNALTGEERGVVPLGTFLLGLAVEDGGLAEQPVAAPARAKKRREGEALRVADRGGRWPTIALGEETFQATVRHCKQLSAHLAPLSIPARP